MLKRINREQKCSWYFNYRIIFKPSVFHEFYIAELIGNHFCFTNIEWWCIKMMMSIQPVING